MEGKGNNKTLHGIQKSFVQVQHILDYNRLLINQINHNHELKIPEKIGHNVGLIRELNDNIRRVADLYAGLSLSFNGPAEGPEEGNHPSGKLGHKRVRPVHNTNTSQASET